MGLKKRWVMVVVVAVVMVGTMQAATFRPSVVRGQAGREDSNAPHIYYYSVDLNAWVIERADGTDRRLLGQGLMPEGTNAVGGPGWSPSGKWFAWDSYIAMPYQGRRVNRGWVVSADGQQVVGRYETPDGYTGVRLAWSPTEDLLMVKELRDTTGSYTRGETRYSLVDPASQRIIASFLAPTSSTPMWTADGQHVIVDSYITETGRDHFYIFDTHGTMTDYLGPTDSIPLDLSPSGEYFYMTPHKLMLENLLTGIQRELAGWPVEDISQSDLYDIEITWMADGTIGYFTMAEALWRVDTTTPRLERMTSESISIIRERLSPTGDYLKYGIDMGEGLYIPAILNLVTQDVIEIPVLEADGLSWGSQWVDNQRLLAYGPDPQADLLDEGLDHPAYFVDAATGMMERFDIQIAYLAMPVPSPDGHYLAWMVDGPMVYDRLSQTTEKFAQDSRSTYSIWGGDVLWHASGEWLIMGDEALISGGDYSQWVSIMRPDGSGRRELTHCEQIEFCVGWLPSKVTPS